MSMKTRILTLLIAGGAAVALAQSEADKVRFFFFDQGSFTSGTGYVDPDRLQLLYRYDAGRWFLPCPTINDRILLSLFPPSSRHVLIAPYQIPGDDPLRPRFLFMQNGSRRDFSVFSIIMNRDGYGDFSYGAVKPWLSSSYCVDDSASDHWTHLTATAMPNTMVNYDAVSGSAEVFVVNRGVVSGRSMKAGFTQVVNMPAGLFFFNPDRLDLRSGLRGGYFESWANVNTPTWTLNASGTSAALTGMTHLVRVRVNETTVVVNPNADILLAYHSGTGAASLWTLAPGTANPLRQVPGSSVSLPAGYTVVSSVGGTILFYNRLTTDYALGSVSRAFVGGGVRQPVLTIDRNVPASAGVLASWSHIIPVLGCNAQNAINCR